MGGNAGGGQRAPQLQPVTVEAPSAAETIGVGTGFIRQGGTAAAQTNVSGRNIQLSGILANLMDGGASVLNPALGQQYTQLQTSVDNATRGLNRQISTLGTRKTTLESELTYLQGLVDAGETLTSAQQRKLSRLPSDIAKIDSRLTPLRGRVEAQNQRLTDFQDNELANAPKATDMLAEKFPELRAALEEATPYLDRMGQLGASGEKLMEALSAGYQAGTISARDVTAALMGEIERVEAERVGAGRLGGSLMQRALQMSQSDGRLDPAANRDATQSARQGFASRGMATGSAALGAELLNRDAYARQRMFQDLGFSQNVQTQDLARRMGNADSGLRASLANQQTQFGREQFNAGSLNQINQANADRSLQASVANEEARRLGNQMNIGMLGQAFTTERMVNQEGLGAALQRGNLASNANMNNMLLNMYGQGNPVGSESIGTAGALASNWANNALNAGMFNANSNMWTQAQNSYGNYGNQQSGTGGMWGGLGGAVLGAGLGALLAAPTGGMSITAGALYGSGIGGGVGTGVGGLFGR
jgi:hypothetical protein